MKYIKKFDTTTQYNNAALDLPNVSLTMDDREVHYNPYDERLVAKYNVTSTSSATKLLGSSSNISAIEIDGIALDSVVTTYTFSTTGVHTVKYTLTDNTSISNNTFAVCSGLTSVTIPSSVTSIGSYAFEGTAWYDNQPDGLVYAGKVAYIYKGTMPENTSISLQEGTLGIASSAFASCSGLTSVTIPNSVTSIGSSAFFYCPDLTTLTVQATTPPTLGSNALTATNANLVIKVPSASVDTYKAASGWSTYASRIQAI